MIKTSKKCLKLKLLQIHPNLDLELILFICIFMYTVAYISSAKCNANLRNKRDMKITKNQDRFTT